MTAERLERCFTACRTANRPALIVFLTVGDPNVETTVACATAALDAGADILELGVPFSDPTADGPVIAAASQRAIRAGGSLRAALGVARAVRAHSQAPLVLFSYLNPILAFGERALPGAAAENGVDGLLVVDLPPEEGPALRQAATEAGVAVIPLVAPTTGRERQDRVVAGASGFVYYVSATGVTGLGDAPLVEAGRAAAELGARAKVPVVVGFGIDSAEKARAVARTGADGVVVGSAVVRAIADAGESARAVAAVRELVGALRVAISG